MGRPLPAAAAGPVPGSLLVVAGVLAAAQLAQAPLLPRAVGALGGAAGDLGALQALGGMAQVVGGLGAGALADRFGGAAVLVASLVAGAVAALISAAGPLWALYAARGLAVFQQGMLGARAVAVQGWDAAGAPEEGRAPRLGMLGAAFGAGFVVGPALGAAFGREDPDRVARGAAVAYLAAALLVLLTAPGGARKRARPPAGRAGPSPASISARDRFLCVVGSPGAPLLLAQKAVGDLCMAIFVGTFSVLLETRYGRGPRQAGYVLSYVGVLAAAAQGGGVKQLERRLGRERAARTALAAMAFAFAALAALPASFGAFLACLAPLSLGSGAVSALNTARFAALVGPSEKGSALAVESAISGVARAAGSGVGVLLRGSVGDAGLFAACAAPIATLLLATRAGGGSRGLAREARRQE